MILGLITFGTLGFRETEGWSWLDCIFMSVMTLTTVGYGSPEPLHTDGKIFSVVLMTFGIGLMLYLLTLLAETMIRTFTDPITNQRRKERKIMTLKDHTIVCGYGQVGEAVATALVSAKKEVVVVDHRTEHLEWAQAHGIHTLVGDATDEEVLRRAGVERASSLVSVINNDPSTQNQAAGCELPVSSQRSAFSGQQKQRAALAFPTSHFPLPTFCGDWRQP